MKNKLYKTFDRVTMVFSPLIESLFDHAETMTARRRMRNEKRRIRMKSGVTALRDAPATGTRHRESFGW